MEISQAVTALAALAQESRLRVFRLVVQSGTEGIPAGEIASSLEIPPATLSFHLKELAHAGLVHSRREGRSIIYMVSAKGISDLMGFLTKDCCQGRPELCIPGCCSDQQRSTAKLKIGQRRRRFVR